MALSTCNRLEITYVLPERCAAHNSSLVLRHLAAGGGIREDLKLLFYLRRDDRAVDHLLRVAAGLDSMVLGENQVLGQPREAYRFCASRGYTRAVLDRLFHGEVREIPNVHLADIDELEGLVLSNRERRAGEIERAESIAAECAREFFAWPAALRLQPTIHSLQEKLRQVAREELAGLKGLRDRGEEP